MTFVPGPILQWGLHVDMWLQQFAWLAPVMKVLSFLGTEDFFVALVPLVYWCISVEAGIDLALVLFSVNGVNGLFKLAFHAPRPYWTSLKIKGLATETSYGLPSGHAAIASSCWPLMARRLHRTWTVWSAVVPAVLLLLTWGVQATLARVTDPMYSLWMIMSRMPDDPRDWSGFVSTAGILGGCLAGLAFQQRYARFSAAGPVGTRILRFMLGIIGVLLIWCGLTIFLPHGTGLIAQIGRFVRYALTGVWTVYVAPIVFLRTGLALLPQDVVCVGRSENDTTGPRES